MSLATDGPLLIALQHVKAMIADADAWSAIASESDIYIDALPPPDPGPDFGRDEIIALRPFCVLWHQPNHALQLRLATADRTEPIASGLIIAQFELNTPAAMVKTPSELGEYVQRIAGRLARTGDSESPGIWDLSGQPGYLPLHRIDIDAYERTDKEEAQASGDAVCFELHFHWGRDR